MNGQSKKFFTNTSTNVYNKTEVDKIDVKLEKKRCIMALLDSGCAKTVCEEAWLQHYLHSVSFYEYIQIESSKSNSSFKFGDSKLVKVFKMVKIPVIIAGVQATVTIDVEYDPLYF